MLRCALIVGAALAALLGSPAEAARRGGPPAAEAPTVLADAQLYQKGKFSAYAADFGKGTLVRGTDYADTITLYPSTFPTRTTVAWNWPVDGNQSIRGYFFVSAWKPSDTAPLVGITPTKVSAVNALSYSLDITTTGVADQYDVLLDIPMTATPGVFAPSSTTGWVAEIGIFHHSPAITGYYVNASTNTQYGTFTDAQGRQWQVAADPTANNGKGPGGAKAPYIMFMPVGRVDRPSGTVDVQAMRAWLVSKGALSGNEYFSGLCLGVEPVQGAGTLTINSFDATFN